MPATICSTASSAFDLRTLADGTIESATFSGPDAIRNVISRVTGGDPSDINGTLRSTIQGADFYFLNPAGVMFGPNARPSTSRARSTSRPRTSCASPTAPL